MGSGSGWAVGGFIIIIFGIWCIVTTLRENHPKSGLIFFIIGAISSILIWVKTIPVIEWTSAAARGVIRGGDPVTGVEVIDNILGAAKYVIERPRQDNLRAIWGDISVTQGAKSWLIAESIRYVSIFMFILACIGILLYVFYIRQRNLDLRA